MSDQQVSQVQPKIAVEASAKSPLYLLSPFGHYLLPPGPQPREVQETAS
jgi:hypothetical protein